VVPELKVARPTTRASRRGGGGGAEVRGRL
jgi:hypothetical protein